MNQRFKAILIKSFDLKQEETSLFITLFFHSFFLGIFIAFYFTPANAVFIQHFESEQLPLAYICAGIGGYLVSALYSFLQKKVNSLGVFLSALLFMLLLPVIYRLSLDYVNAKWLSFLVFMWAWPFISLVAIESGGLAIRFLDLRQVKRLFGLINMGGVLGSILGYLIIPSCMRLFSHEYDLFFISAFSVMVSILLLLYLYRRFPEKEDKQAKNIKLKSKNTWMSLLKEKYFMLIFIAATFSMLIIYFSDFTFLVSIKSQKTLFQTPEEYHNFLSYTYGGLKIGEFILSYFSSRILSKYGVKLGLTVLPVVTTLLILGASISGLIGSTGIVFFVFIVANKCFERILRRGLDDPSFNVLYQPLYDDQKLAVQTKVGIIMQLSTGIAGLFLFSITELLKAIHLFNIQYFSLFFLPILIVWVIITTRLYIAYKERLREILSERSRLGKKIMNRYIYGSDVLEDKLKVDINEAGLDTVRLCVTILSETNAKVLEPYAESLLDTNDPTIVKAILQKIDPTWSKDLIDTISLIYNSETNSTEIKEFASRAIDNLDLTDTIFIKPERLQELSESSIVKDKQNLIKYFLHFKVDNAHPYILKLLQDKNKLVRQAAIRLAGIYNHPELDKRVIELLYYPEYYHVCVTTLSDMGNRVIHELDKHFVKETPITVLHKIVEIFARIATPESKSLLVNYLGYPNKEIQTSIIRGLYYSQYQANETEMPIVKTKLKEIVETILWILVCINDLESQTNTLKIIQALDIERENHFELLFDILSFIYDPATIDLIKTNIKGENTIFALEIIDNFISQEIKEPIIPLFDKIPVSQRIKKLSIYFPMQKMIFTDRLKEILIADYSKIDSWTKAKVIELLGRLHKRKKTTEIIANTDIDFQEIDIWTVDKAHEVLGTIRKSEMPDEIFLCLFHPDELVYSTAAKTIYEENPVSCVNYLKKFSSKSRQDLIDNLSTNDSDLLVDKVKFVKRVPIFFATPENILVKLAKLLKTVNLRKSDEVSLHEESGIEKIIIVIKGKLTFKPEDTEEISFSRNDIIVRGTNLPEGANQVQVKSASMVLEGNRYEYFNILIDETDLVQYLLESTRPSKK